MTERTSPGRRATDGEVVAVVESSFLRRFALWFIVAGAGLCFAGGLWAADMRGDLSNLQESQFTREEAAGLRNAVDLLRAEITYLRADLNRLEGR